MRIVNVEAEHIAQTHEVLLVQLLHLVGRVTASEVGTEQVALNGVGENNGGLAGVLGCRLVGGVNLAVVVATALERPDLFIRPVLDHGLGAGIAAEEVLADERTVVGLEALVVTIERCVHDVDEGAVVIGLKQRIPFAAPNDLDDVPAGTAEERLELLNDLAVTANRAVEALQIAVDDEVQVVQTLL